MRIYQLMEALDFGDAVSNDAINIARLLKEIRYDGSIFAKYYHPKVAKYCKNYSKLKVNTDDIIIFHFSGKSTLVEFLRELKCRKVMLYHNITPSEYFKELPEFYYHCYDGRQQLKDLVDEFDLGLGDSEFNKRELEEYGFRNTDVLPIIINFERFSDEKINKNLFNRYSEKTTILSVGRLAPNKRYEDVIKIFYYYNKIDPNSLLLLVGNHNGYEAYYKKLIELVSKLGLNENIIFSGRVSFSDLKTYYKTANVFISMSEHEGFCVPLLESMFFRIPTIAYKAGAVPETMGLAGVRVNQKDYIDIAEFINLLLTDSQLKERIIYTQNQRIKDFSKEKMKEKLRSLIDEVSSL